MLRDRVHITESDQRGMRIAICGGNGAGKTTVGNLLAKRTGYRFLDIEDYCFDKTHACDDLPDYLYQYKRNRDDVAALLYEDILQEEGVVIAASKLDYGNEIEDLLSAVIYLEVTDVDRMRRVKERSYEKYGERVLPCGDLYEVEAAFFQRVKHKPLTSIRNWYSQLKCPVFVIDGSKRVEQTVDWIINNVIMCD